MLIIGRRALMQLGVGTVLGMAIALWLLMVLEQAGRIPTHPPLTVALTLGVSVMLVIGTLACIAPLQRVLRIMPTEALREGG